MKRTFFILLVVGAALVAAAPAFAQTGRAQQGRGQANGPRYDPATVETVRGTIRSIDRHDAKRGNHQGVHLEMEAGDQTLVVHLGPSWFLDKQDLKPAVGDAVEVVGSRITYEGAPALIAREVKRGDTVLRLRDEAGLPVWRGERGGRRGSR